MPPETSTLTSEEAQDLLHGREHKGASAEPTDELSHPWGQQQVQLFDKPLLRIRDVCSGSQPDPRTGNMDARARHAPLHTRELRKEALTVHIDHGDWTATPFISFNSSAGEITDLARMRRAKGRGEQFLTVVDPMVRRERGLPVLHMGLEMKHYGVRNPYGKGVYCEEHYLCLWQVTKEEIVGHWQWKDLVRADDWYEEIIVPAVEEFRRRRLKEKENVSKRARAKEDIGNVLAVDMAKLGFTSPAVETQSIQTQDHKIEEGFRKLIANAG